MDFRGSGFCGSGFRGLRAYRVRTLLGHGIQIKPAALLPKVGVQWQKIGDLEFEV